MSIGAIPSISAPPDYYSLGPPTPPPPTMVTALSGIPDHSGHYHDAGSSGGTMSDHSDHSWSGGGSSRSSAAGLNVTI